MSTSNSDAKTAPSDSAPSPENAPAGGGQGHGTGGIPFEDYKKKLEASLSELGKQMEVLKDLLSKAAHDAKASLEQQVEKLQKDHAEEFERLSKLRAAGEAGLNTLGARLDKLVEDVTTAVTTALRNAKPADAGKSDATSGTEPGKD